MPCRSWLAKVKCVNEPSCPVSGWNGVLRYKTFPMSTELNDRSQMPFGKYQGKTMANVPAQYLLWLYNNGCNHLEVKKYILNNLEILKKEAK